MLPKSQIATPGFTTPSAYIVSRHALSTSEVDQKNSASQTEQTPECTGRLSLYKTAFYLALLLLSLVDFTVSHPPPPWYIPHPLDTLLTS